MTHAATATGESMPHITAAVGEIVVPFLVQRCGLAFEYKEGYRKGLSPEPARNPVYYRTGDPQLDHAPRSQHGLAHDAWQQGFQDARSKLFKDAQAKRNAVGAQ